MARNLILAALVLALAACGKNAKDTPPATITITQDKLVAYECGTPPASDPLNAKPVQWVVQNDAQGKAWYALTPDHYRNLVGNIANMVLGSKQMKGQRDFYAKCVDRSKAAVAEQNKGLQP